MNVARQTLLAGFCTHVLRLNHCLGSKPDLYDCLVPAPILAYLESPSDQSAKHILDLHQTGVLFITDFPLVPMRKK